MYASTGFRNQSLGNKLPRELLKDFVIMLYGGGGTPSSADAAALGTLLVKLTVSGATAKIAQVMRIAPVAGTAAAAEWRVTVNNNTVVFVDDGTPTEAEICTGLTALLNALAGGTMTTPAGQIETPNCDGKFTVTNNGTTVDITSSVAGVSIEVSSTVAAGGGSVGTGTLTTSTQVDNAYGLRWEPYSGIASGILELLSSDSLSGAFLAKGTILYGRICADDDTGLLSTTAVRLQLAVAPANAEITVSHVEGEIGEVVSASVCQIYLEAA